jgi:hypothetical protein
MVIVFGQVGAYSGVRFLPTTRGGIPVNLKTVLITAAIAGLVAIGYDAYKAKRGA